MRVAELPNEQEVHLTHRIAHVLRTEQAAVGFDTGLNRFYLTANVNEQFLEHPVTVRLKGYWVCDCFHIKSRSIRQEINNTKDSKRSNS